MSIYWMEGSAYCPIDHHFLEECGTVTLKVYRCSDCGNEFVYIAGQPFNGKCVEIRSDLIRPREVVHAGRHPAAEKFERILSFSL